MCGIFSWIGKSILTAYIWWHSWFSGILCVWVLLKGTLCLLTCMHGCCFLELVQRIPGMLYSLNSSTSWSKMFRNNFKSHSCSHLLLWHSSNHVWEVSFRSTPVWTLQPGILGRQEILKGRYSWYSWNSNNEIW